MKVSSLLCFLVKMIFGPEIGNKSIKCHVYFEFYAISLHIRNKFKIEFLI